MPQFTLLIAALLIILGPALYFPSSSPSMTAFIPTVLGVLIAICGVIALQGGAARKHGMHVAAVLALLGALAAGGRGIPSLFKMIGGEEVNQLAVAGLMIMLVLCVVLLVAAVRSFVAARKARLAGA